MWLSLEELQAVSLAGNPEHFAYASDIGHAQVYGKDARADHDYRLNHVCPDYSFDATLKTHIV